MNTTRSLRKGIRIDVHPNLDSLQTAAAKYIVSILEARLRAKNRASLVLSGGSTPRPIFERLAASAMRRRLNWDQINIFWGDERWVPPENHESNFGMAWHAFLSKIRIPPANIHRISGEIKSADKAALAYQAEIRKIHPASGIPSFDLVLLGLGEDGHTASLFPEMQWNKKRLVIASFVEKLGTFRISMTPRLFNAAHTVIFIVAGSGKSKAVANVLENPECKVPASLIRPTGGRLIWMLDRAAAGELTRYSQDKTSD